MESRKLFLQDIQKTGGVNITPRDRRYLILQINGTLNLSHGEKLKYLMGRGYMTKDKQWTPLGNAALKALRRERIAQRQKEERKVDRDRH